MPGVHSMHRSRRSVGFEKRITWRRPGDAGRYVPMRTLLIIPILIAIGCSGAVDDSNSENSANRGAPTNEIASPNENDLSVIEVPRPNSGTYTTEQAEKRLIPALERSVGIASDSLLITDWKNPTHGFRVYVDANGKIHTVDFLDRSSTGMDGLNAALDLSHAMQHGNPLSVLVASETSGWTNETKSKIIKLLFQPSIQLYVIGK